MKCSTLVALLVWRIENRKHAPKSCFSCILTVSNLQKFTAAFAGLARFCFVFPVWSCVFGVFQVINSLQLLQSELAHVHQICYDSFPEKREQKKRRGIPGRERGWFLTLRHTTADQSTPDTPPPRVRNESLALPMSPPLPWGSLFTALLFWRVIIHSHQTFNEAPSMFFSTWLKRFCSHKKICSSECGMETVGRGFWTRHGQS